MQGRRIMSPSGERETAAAFPRKTAPKIRPRIGILLSNLADVYQAAVLHGAHETARARGAHLLCFVGGPLGSTRRRSAQQNRVYDFVSRANIDALTVVAGSIGADCGSARLS